MSLFKLKPIWTKSFSAEEFDQRHLAVGKLGRQASIALASFEGWLRVYIINRPDELSISTVYENKFESGIIDVKFVSHPDEKIKNNAIGILFYRRFTYLYFDSNPENKYIPKLVSIDVEPAFGIGISPVCLFTLNSTIQYLNPIEILKIKVADPIYPYTLNFDKTYFVDGQELVEMEGSTQQWRIIVGRIRQLFVFIDTIVVIGQRALWQICDAKIAKTKVMQEDISCGAIAFKSINSYNILTANFNNQLFVYSSNYELLWAIKLDYVAIKIIVCQHEEIKGMLTILSDQGTLQLAYSGVQVPDSVIQPLSQKIDYSVVQAQTQAFLDKLKANDDKKQKKPQRISEAKQGYKIYFGQIQKSYESLQQKDKLYQIDGKIVKYRLFIETTSRQILRNFKVQINLPFNLYSIETNKQSTVTRLGDKIVFDIYANNESFPYERQINVIIRYQNDQLSKKLQYTGGSPFIKIQNVDIPMGLQCIIAGFESKQSFQNKIVIKSNVEMPSFNDLFPDLINRKSAQQKKTIRFVLSNGIECVITYNKGFNKAKIQSKQYSGLCYIISQFANHIRLINLKLQTKIDLSVQIPLQEFFSIMKQHYDYRLKLKESFEEVQLKAEQFKNSQKKLLVRMKEKMTNLGSMDKILEYTFQRVVQSSTKYEQISHEMDIINHNLCVAIKLIIELLFIRSNPSEKAKNIANGILGYEKQSLQYGWQQKIYANSCYYLNKKFKKKDSISLQQLQKIPLFVISKVNNGDWN